MTELTVKQTRLLTEAKLWMLRLMPYYGTFIIGTPLVPMKKYQGQNIDTAATDYRSIMFNPTWMLGDDADVPVQEVVRVLGHEVLHMTFKHGLRQRYRIPALWNIAADYAINPILEEGQVGVYPSKVKDKLINNKYTGKSAEDIYDLLLKENPNAEKSGKIKLSGGVTLDLRNPDPGGMGGFLQPLNVDGSEMSDAEKAALERDIDAKTSTAAAAAKSQGKLPAGLELFLKIAMKPEVDWRERLWQFVLKIRPSDITWNRPRRRFIWSDLYLPSELKEGTGEIAVIMDTSGSISFDGAKSEGAQFAAEIKSIHEDVRPLKLHVMYCDSEVAGYDVFDPEEEFRLKPRGGGGTDFRPPFKQIDKLGLDIQCAIYLTDMYGTFPEGPLPYPVMWVATSDTVAPFGETIRIMRR